MINSTKSPRSARFVGHLIADIKVCKKYFYFVIFFVPSYRIYITPAHLKGKAQGDPAAGPNSEREFMLSLEILLRRKVLFTPVTKDGAQGEQMGEPVGEQMQLWIKSYLTFGRKCEPGHKQLSRWSQSCKPLLVPRHLIPSLELSFLQGRRMDRCHTFGRLNRFFQCPMFSILASSTNMRGVWMSLS